MIKRAPTIFSIAIWVFASQCFAAAKPSDQEIAQKLVGSWRIPSTSTDYDPADAHTVEIFEPDGTYDLYSFQEGNCKTMTLLATASWTIEGGVLNSFYSDTTDQDDIVTITNDKMTLHSQSDGTIFTRVKFGPCSKPTS